MVLSVSVAMATFNGSRFIEPQLRSIAAQSRRPSELVVYDDHSADATTAIVRTFAEHAPFPVRLHVNAENCGYRENFMRAARACQGDIIAFCDQDDVWDAGKLSLTAEAFEARPDLLLLHHAVRLVGNGDGARQPDRALQVVAANDGPLWAFAEGHAILFRRSLLSVAGAWERSVDWNDSRERLGHDQFFCVLAAALGETAQCLMPLMRYRAHRGSATFGLRVESARESGLRRWLASPARRIADGGAAATALASILGSIARDPTQPAAWRTNAAAGAARWSRVAAGYAGRGAIYDGTRSERLAALRLAVRVGLYRGSHGDLFGRLSVIKDLSHGIVLRDSATRR